MSCSCPPVTVQPVHAVTVPRLGTRAKVEYRAVTVGPSAAAACGPLCEERRLESLKLQPTMLVRGDDDHTTHN